VGILTGEDRDKWAKARQELVSISATNARNLDIIDKSLFVLCLDEVRATCDARHLFHWLHVSDGSPPREP
jgi:hypothetical protein